ncbi:MAG: type IV pilin-like G/H family protein [Pseudanabaenaceae cyanobacterium SKYGB_i_bin29]|nr:prepilin-type N-terminal cleavage/methylation domain-containing protein [Pseudanabaenaceae cyanobacterium SKYG29]MDW8420621.1 type IV pilin-like G/H family protein [Pseudanabaenaceae cyanobacterium SKYGB_i_bin29]
MKSEFKAKLIQHLLSRKDSEKGFTLIELLVVVIIVGILAAIALPTFLAQVNKARHAEARNFVSTALKAQQTVYLETNQFASNFTALQAEVGLSTNLTYYTPGINATNPTSGIGFLACITAAGKRDVLKDYTGVAWAAIIGGATIPEIYTAVFEEEKAGAGGASVPCANPAPATNSAVASAPTNYVNLGK